MRHVRRVRCPGMTNPALRAGLVRIAIRGLLGGGESYLHFTDSRSPFCLVLFSWRVTLSASPCRAITTPSLFLQRTV